jgi:hypothetical protein
MQLRSKTGEPAATNRWVNLRNQNKELRIEYASVFTTLCTPQKGLKHSRDSTFSPDGALSIGWISTVACEVPETQKSLRNTRRRHSHPSETLRRSI